MHSLHLLFALGASVAFTLSKFQVIEDDGPAQPVLLLSRPIECCSVSVTVKLQDVTAKGKYLQYACVCASVCMIVFVVFYRW